MAAWQKFDWAPHNLIIASAHKRKMSSLYNINDISWLIWHRHIEQNCDHFPTNDMIHKVTTWRKAMILKTRILRHGSFPNTNYGMQVSFLALTLKIISPD
jgi:hypothetical protein